MVVPAWIACSALLESYSSPSPTTPSPFESNSSPYTMSNQSYGYVGPTFGYLTSRQGIVLSVFSTTASMASLVFPTPPLTLGPWSSSLTLAIKKTLATTIFKSSIKSHRLNPSRDLPQKPLISNLSLIVFSKLFTRPNWADLVGVT
ncbi:unnamed protein product [Ilex paraguariensis]|uniref:Uncharacterized protein n=1 Tax=Ilex paraguariensis TaxID=185542 RepID=A0ABC8SX82_9AQUA